MSVLFPEAKDPKGPETVAGVGNEDELVVRVAYRGHRRPGQRLRHVVCAECKVKSMLPLGSCRKRGQGESRRRSGQVEATTLIDAGGNLGTEAGDKVADEGGGCGQRVGAHRWRGRRRRQGVGVGVGVGSSIGIGAADSQTGEEYKHSICLSPLPPYVNIFEL